VSTRRLEVLQWFGFLTGGVLWFATFLAGTTVAIATCNPAGRRWEIPYDGVQVALLCCAVVAIVAAEVAAVLVFRATRRAEEEGPPPHARMKLFAIAAMTGNVIFLAIIVLSFVATVVDPTCHQA
jgi:heme/copper-type cytochrome/quinol oxidase subunit 2